MLENNLTILLIDDCMEDRETYRRYLNRDERYTYTIFEAEYGRNGLELCRTLQPDLILLDFMLPDLDGIEFLSKLKNLDIKNKSSVVMLTGQGNESIAVEAMKQGAADYLVKGNTSPQNLHLTIHNVIENSQLRQQLKQSEERFRASVENMLDCFGIYSAIRDESGKIVDFKIEYVNAAACENNYMTKEEQIGKRLCEILPAHRQTGLFDDYCQVVETGEPLIKESLIYVDFYGKQFLTRTFDIRVTKLADGFVAAWRDVTKQKQAEEKLQVSQQFVQTVADTIPGILYVYDLIEQRNIYLNHQVSEVLGYTPEQVLAMGAEFTKQIMHPDDLAQLPAHIAKFNSAQPGATFSFEYRMRDVTGEWRWFYSRDTLFSTTSEGLPKQILGTAIDISDRVSAEEALLASEQFKRTILENSADCIKVMDLDTKLLFMNCPGICLMEIEDISLFLGKRWLDFWENEEDYHAAYQAVEDAKAGGIGRFRGFCRTAKGTPKCWDVIITPVQDEQSQLKHLVSISRDITPYKEVEEQLRLSNERFELAAAAVNCLIYDWNIEQNNVIRTEGLTRILGYSLKDTEPTCEWWNNLIHPDDLPKVVAAGEQIWVKGENFYSTEYRVRHQNHQYIYVLDQGIVIRNSEGHPIRAVGSTIDISDRIVAEDALRQSEKRYRYLAETIPQIVWTADLHGLIDYTNWQWCEYSGLTLEQSLGWGWLTTVHPDDAPWAEELWLESIHTGAFYEVEYRIKRADHTYRWHLVRGLPLKDEQGQIIKWFGTCTDIDEQKQLEVERARLFEIEQALRAEAEAANRAKDEFIAMVSHDLRAPLNAILGWSQLLRKGNQTEASQQRALETIERNAKAQAELIEDLLDVSRMIQGKLQIVVAPVELLPLLEDAVSNAYPTAKSKAIRLESKFEPLAEKIAGDQNRLQQILGNLLSNAINFTPEGGLIQVQLQRDDSYAQIIVRDTGQGISPELLPYIFERFRQGYGASNQKGLGLGLAIARHLVELHGGTIQAESPGVGQGAIFTIRLPLIVSNN